MDKTLQSTVITCHLKQSAELILSCRNECLYLTEDKIIHEKPRCLVAAMLEEYFCIR